MTTKEITDKLISLMKESNIPLQINAISRQIGIASDSPEYDILKSCLHKLIGEGIIVKRKKRKYLLKTYSYETTYSGAIRFEQDRIYVDTASHLKKIFIKRKKLKTALNRDMVEIKITDVKKNGKAHGEVVRVIKRAERKIRGTIDSDGEFHFLVPDDKSYYVDFLDRKSVV